MTAARRVLVVSACAWLGVAWAASVRLNVDEFHERLLEAIRWINGQPR
jgi:hypothetical protein